MKILLVEDELRHRDLLARRLRARGFEVVVVEDGVPVLERTRAEQPDLVLMDLLLPVRDGLQATRDLKADPETGHIPVIAVSASDLPEMRRRSVAAGCDDFEPKPIVMERLLGRVDRVLARADAARGGEDAPGGGARPEPQGAV